MKKSVLFLIVSISTQVYAVSGVGGCTGKVNGDEVSMSSSMGNVFDLSTGKADVTVSGRFVSHFEGSDMKANIVARTFTITNSQGDSASGKLTNVFRKSGVIHHLRIPAYGIDYKNFHVKCWSKRN